MGPIHWIREWGLAYGIYPWVSTLVMENSGRRFWVERACFFLGGAGEGKRNSRSRLPRRFRRTTRVPNTPVYVIYYIFRSGGFRYGCLQDIAKGSSILDNPGQTHALFGFDNSLFVKYRKKDNTIFFLSSRKGEAW
jgi:hypothetical protein